MTNRNRELGASLIGILAFMFFVMILIGGIGGGMMIEYVLEFWLSYAKGKMIDVPFVPCMIVGVFVGWNVAVPVWLITWILSLFL